jgi:hypothetical protein
MSSKFSGRDVREVMDRQQILVINIRRGRLGQDNAILLGSPLLTSLEQAALSERTSQKRGDRIMGCNSMNSKHLPPCRNLLFRHSCKKIAYNSDRNNKYK